MTGLAMVRRASRRFRRLSSALRNGLKAESLKELSYVIKNVFFKRKYLKEFKSRAFQTTWIERFEAFLATCSLDPDLVLCFVQTWIEYV